MTILHSGASRKFADNWLKIFSGQKRSGKPGRATSAGGKASAASSAKSAKQKEPKPGRARKAAPKKKSSARKSGR